MGELEPFTITQAQWDALNTLPPGFYFVCAGCRKFDPAETEMHCTSAGYFHARCVNKW